MWLILCVCFVHLIIKSLVMKIVDNALNYEIELLIIFPELSSKLKLPKIWLIYSL